MKVVFNNRGTHYEYEMKEVPRVGEQVIIKKKKYDVDMNVWMIFDDDEEQYLLCVITPSP